VARHLFTGADPWNGLRKSLWVSVVTAGGMAIMGLLFLNSVFMALMFGFLAFQSYQGLSGRF
jgi:sterol desaturase/sphingolipid hydroxylase (fatty acid hydroxylase superfamily)